MSNKHVLIVDDEEGIRLVLVDLFTELGWIADQSSNGTKALDMALSKDYDLVIVDLSLPGIGGLEILRNIKESKPDVPVVMITGYASMKSALQALKLGAYDYLTKPFKLDYVQRIAEHAVERKRLIYENKYLQEELRLRYGFDNIVGLTPSAQQAYLLAAQVADSNASVLILGETGTGKEYIARAIHYQSQRAGGPFIKVSCAALP
ncbi:MAG: response regulator, partial [Armatimonadetes bacterium]|nr:response regulator [Armatimonadota bacterium]